MYLRCLVGLLFVISSLAHAVDPDDDSDYGDENTIRVSDLPKNPPKFEQFPATQMLDGKPTVPDTHSHPRSRLFRTAIRYGAEEGPNFAGHYTILSWGCGSGCAAFAIVDAKTGKVFHPHNLREVSSNNVEVGKAAVDKRATSDRDWVIFDINSKLIVVIGDINDDPKLRGISYFVWERETLRRVRFVPRPRR